MGVDRGDGSLEYAPPADAAASETAPALGLSSRASAFVPAADPIVAVLSLSRSGSSLVSRLLSEVVGIDFGDPIDHIPANRNNPDGYFEQTEVLAINEEILAAAGGTVFSPPAVSYAARIAPDAAERLQRRIRDFAADQTQNRSNFGFKDPRLSLTLPLWRRVLPSIVPIIVFRDPGAAAVSIQDQGGIPLQRAFELWYEYYHRIFKYTSGMRRHVVCFERLLDAPAVVVAGMARHLDVELDPRVLNSGAEAIVQRDRPRSSGKIEPVAWSPYINPETKLVYGYLRRIVEADEQPDFAYLGAMMAGLAAYRSTAQAQPTARGGEVSKARAEAADPVTSEEGVADVEARLAELTRMLEARSEELTQLRMALTESGSRLTEDEVDEREALRRRVGELRHALETRADELAESRAALAPLRAEVEHLRGRTQHLTQELREKTEEVRKKGDESARRTLEAIERADILVEQTREELLRAQKAAASHFARQIEARDRDIHELRHARYVDQLQSEEKDRFLQENDRRLREAHFQLARMDDFRRAAEGLAARLARLTENGWSAIKAPFHAHDRWRETGPALDPLVAQSAQWKRSGFSLQLSVNLQSVIFQEYRFRGRDRLVRAVALAPTADLPWKDGYLGVEIVSPSDEIVAHVWRPIAELPPDSPAEFAFAPILVTSGRGWRLRAFCRYAQTPVRVLELRKRRLAIGPLVRRPFCALIEA
jgi:hypothetical protein